MVIRISGRDTSRNQAPAANHQPHDRSPFTTADSSGHPHVHRGRRASASVLMVLNNVMVVGLQIPLVRFGTTTAAARSLLNLLAAVFAPGRRRHGTRGRRRSRHHGRDASLHAAVSWELSLALAPDTARGAYLGVHDLAQAMQRSFGPLAVTAAIATGPAGWLTFGTLIALTCTVQHRLARTRLGRPPLSVPPVTVSEH